MIRAILNPFVTLLPMVLVSAFVMGLNHAYAEHWIDSLGTAVLLGAGAWFSSQAFIPIWAAVRSRRHWYLAIAAQWIAFVPTTVAFGILMVTTPHGAEPPRCGTSAMSLLVVLLMWAVSYLPVASLVAWVIHRRRWHRRAAPDECAT